MRSMAVIRIATALCLGTVAFSASAVQRTFVASYGSDANPCSISLPCRGFARALTQTDPGGEIVALDSAGYGPVTIDKSVSLSAAPGVYAAITAFTGDGITINVPPVNGEKQGTVTLSGLVINGLGGTTGVNVIDARSVAIERCRITGFVNGIAAVIGSDAAIPPGPAISVTNSFVGFNTARGITVATQAGTTGTLTATVANSQVMRTGDVAIRAGGNVRLSVVNTVVNHCDTCIQATSQGGTSRMFVANSLITSVSVAAIKSGPTVNGSTEVTVCDNTITAVGGTAPVFNADPGDCGTGTCRIFSCGNLVSAFTTLEVPPGVVEPTDGTSGRPVIK